MNIDLNAMETYELLIFSAIGLAVLLFGFRLKKAAFFVIWFLLGYVLTSKFLLSLAFQWIPQLNSNPAFWNILLPIAGGLLLGLLGFSIEKFCVAGITFITTIVVAINYFGPDMQVIVISAIIGVILAGLATAMIKPATVIATSVVGAYVVTLVILFLCKIDSSIYYFPILIGLSALGSIFQFVTTKRIR